MAKHLTKEEEEKIINLYQKDIPTRIIREEYGFSAGKIKGCLSRNKITIKRLDYRTYKNEPLVLDMYINQNKAMQIIQKELKMRRETIRKILLKNNIKILSCSEQNQYKINENYFEIIDSDEKAYWLGWLFSDGNISGRRIRLGLQMRDIKVLENFKKCLSSEIPISIYTVKHGKLIGHQYCHLDINNKKMSNDLRKYGMIERKSLILEYPKNLNNQFFFAFMRGYIDGDGSIGIHKSGKKQFKKFSVDFISSKKFIFQTIEKLRNLGFIFRPTHNKKHHKDVYRATNCHKIQIIEFLSKLYENSSMITRLDRKYQKYIEMQEFLVKNPINKSMIRTKY